MSEYDREQLEKALKARAKIGSGQHCPPQLRVGYIADKYGVTEEWVIRRIKELNPSHRDA